MLKRLLTPFLISLLAASGLLLGGCQPSDPAADLQADYLSRVARALEQAPPPAFDRQLLLALRPPAKRELRQSAADSRISLLNLLVDSADCPRLRVLISERNSVLGKVMQPSHQLAYEMALIDELQSCLTHTRPHTRSNDWHSELASLLRRKQQELPLHYWNLFASDELRQQLRFAEHGTPPNVNQTQWLDSLTSLAELGEQLRSMSAPSAASLDALLQPLANTEAGGQLLHSLVRLTYTLEQGTQLLNQRATNKPLCPIGKPTPQARIVQNVMVKYYAGQLQPYLAQVSQQAQQWHAQLARLRRLPNAPLALQGYLAELDQRWQRFEHATQAHVQAWQDTLRRCQLAPGQSGWQSSAPIDQR